MFEFITGTIGAIRQVSEGLIKVMGWWTDRHDVVRSQAKRMLMLFERHGVPRQQIIRILPSQFAIPMTAFANADKLKSALTPALLDWACDTFCVSRAWLDGVRQRPHEPVDVYKHPKRMQAWLQERVAVLGGNTALLHVLMERSATDLQGASGPFVVVLEECFGELDRRALSRYWMVSEGWHFEHQPCAMSLLCLMTIAESLHITLCGHEVDRKHIKQFEGGQLLAPDAIDKRRHGCRVVDWVPAAGNDASMSPYHQAVWREARERLIDCGLEDTLWFDKSLRLGRAHPSQGIPNKST